MLRFRKTAQDVMAFAQNGDLATSGFYLEGSSNTVQLGELSIRRGAPVRMTSRRSGTRRDVALQGRLFETALFPGQGLQIRHAVHGIQAEFDTAGDLYLRGRVTNILPNPALPGPHSVDQVVYAAPGLNYGGDAEYVSFESPSPGYATRMIDVSDFADLPTFPSWPFNATNVPINGLLRIPTGTGAFPLVLIAHGNHGASENSTPGYLYLLDLLASQGMIAGSIDCNFLNGFNSGENDGRAIVHLEHVKQFQIWNQQPGHPLHNKVDLSNIMIIGHSRGGEGVAHASAFNVLASVVPDPGDPPVPLDGSLGLGPYNFALKALVAIAPTENQYEPIGGPVRVRDNYFIIHGSRDGDVFDFQGQLTYDRAQPINLAHPSEEADGFKALSWCYGANHNHFNSVWGTDGSPFISRSQQENVAKVYISALAQATLFQRGQYLDLLKDSRVAHQQGWIPNVVLVNQYQDFQRTFIAHYEEDDNITTPSPPVAGTIDTSQVTAAELSFNQGSYGNLYQQTDGLQLEWTSSGQRYDINISPAGLNRGLLHLVVLRTGQSDDSKNQVDRFQDFTIRLTDNTSSHDARAADFCLLPYPAELARGSVRRSVMQTIRVPLSIFANAGVDVDNIRHIALIFDQPISETSTVQGSLYVDEIQLSH